MLKTILIGLASVTALLAADYKVKQTVPVPGDAGWDYLSVDANGRRVYVSHGIQVDVLDADALKVVGTISPTLGVHGIALASKLNRGFISAGQSNDVAVFDLKTQQITSRIPTGKKPDGIIYDGFTKRVIVSNGGSGSSTIIDAEGAKAVGDIDLGGKPEFGAADGKGKVFVNLEDKNEMVRIDPVALKVEARWPLAPCEGPSALAMDRAGRRLFVGCHNNMMTVVNADTGAIIQTAPIGAHVDAAAFDKEAKTVFFSCGDGTVSVFQEETPDKLVAAGTIATEPGAKTAALDPKTHNLFLSVANRDGKTVLPGTFHVLVCAR